LPQSFQVDLRGVVDLLSRHLYSSPSVYLRELLQNAVDALHARELREPGFRGSVRIAAGTDAGGTPTLVVRDDGIGLTEDEVHAFLATIGRSSKRDELDFPRGDFLGQFGIGLLSCFMVSDEITVVTRSATGAPAIRWQGRSDGSYTLEPLGHDVEPGTSVHLRARPDGAELLDPATVRALAEKFGGLLPWPVTLTADGRTERIGGGGLPWRWEADTPGQRRETLLAWGKETFGVDFFDVIPVRAPVADLEGLAFVLPYSPSPNSRQSSRVYLKRMLLSENAAGLLPDWAFFVRCVVDAGELRPTASREALYEDDALEATREALGRELRRYLVRLAATNPERLAELLALHHLAIKALAVHDREFFAMMVRWLPFETSSGTMTLAEYRRRWPVVRYTRTRDTFRQLAQVAAAQELCIVNGGYTHDTELIEQLPLISGGAEVEPMEPADLLSSFADVPGAGTGRFVELARAALAPYGCELELRRFEPASMPTLYAPGEAGLRRSIDAARDVNGDGAWAGIMDALGGPAEPPPGGAARLCLNEANPLVRGLIGVTDQGLVTTAIELLYVQALLLGHHPLRPPEMELLNGSLLGLIDRCVVPRVPRDG
jgi:molecular chaperone HtpG